MSHSTTVAAGPVDGAAVYTVRQAAGLLGLSLGATYSLVRAGDVPAKKLGGRWVVPKAPFHEWLNRPESSSSVAEPSVGGWTR